MTTAPFEEMLLFLKASGAPCNIENGIPGVFEFQLPHDCHSPCLLPARRTYPLPTRQRQFRAEVFFTRRPTS